MSREYKYRGKRVDNGEWIYGYLCFIYIDTDKARIYSPELVASYDVSLESVGQYIGIEDKNKKEIYESDIIRRGDINFGDIFQVKIDNIKVNIPQLGNSVTIKAVILFDEKTGYKQVMDINQQLISIETNTEYEIVGNIYENKTIKSLF